MKKLILVVLAIFGALINYTPTMSKNIETINVDTLYKGFDTGTTTALKFSNNGGRILMFNHNGELYIRDGSYIGKILDIGANKTITKFDVDEYYKYIFYSIGNEAKTRITDYQTRKTSDSLNGDFYLTKDYLILKLDYTYNGNNINYNFKRINIKDLSKVDTFTIVRTQDLNYRFEIGQIKILYQQNKMYFEEVKKGFGPDEGQTSTSWFEIDFNTLNFQEININNGISGKVVFSEDASVVVTYSKVFELEGGQMVYKGTNLYVNGFYNDTISETNLINLFQIKEQSIRDNICVLLNRYIFFSALILDGNKELSRIFAYDLSLKKILKLADFDYSIVASYYHSIIFSNNKGCLGSLYSLKLQMVKPTDTDGDGRLNISEFGNLIYIDIINYIDYYADFLSKDYELDNDIDASETKNFPYNAGFGPLGQNGKPFAGGFDGQGHKITNLFINRPGEEDIAFLGATKGNKKIENLIFENCTIIGGPYTGCIASKVLGNQIENCSVTGRIEGTDYVGGLVGSFDGTKYQNSIKGCHTDVTVLGTKSAIGGLVGKSYSPIINCFSKGNVTGKLYVGGFVGYNESGLINNCFTTSNTIGQEITGGLVGYNRKGTINHCFTTSTTIGRKSTGGLVGYNQNGTISDCYAMGNVSCDSTVGGLIGYDEAGKISNSYSVGAINGKIFMGGLVGFSNEGEFKNTFWDRETSGKIKSFGGVSKTTNEMKTKSTFTDAGWDFNNVWDIDDVTNMGYPFLRQIAVSVEMESNPKESNALVYPNPTINKANLKVLLLENTNISIDLYSLTGCKIKSIYSGNLSCGEHNFDLDFSDFTNGIYSILIHIDNAIINRWVVIQK